LRRVAFLLVRSRSICRRHAFLIVEIRSRAIPATFFVTQSTFRRLCPDSLDTSLPVDFDLADFGVQLVRTVAFFTWGSPRAVIGNSAEQVVFVPDCEDSPLGWAEARQRRGRGATGAGLPAKTGLFSILTCRASRLYVAYILILWMSALIAIRILGIHRSIPTEPCASR
jgi:hypothetical protein